MKSCSKTHMKHALAITIGSAFAFAFAFAAHASGKANDDPHVLAQVQSLYGLDEEGAIQRLAAEAAASDVHRRISRLVIEGYAGAWFDGDTQRLHVALSDPASESVVKRLGAVPVSATWSLRELESVQDRIQAETLASLGETDLFAIHVDVIKNRIVIEVLHGNVDRLQKALASHGEIVEVRGASREALTLHPTANIRGADGTRNKTFEQNPLGLGYYACSVGFTTENGYYTAGHCGNRGYTSVITGIYYPPSDIVLTDGVTPLGTVGDSTFPFKSAPQFNLDMGWVQTVPGHALLSKINGYSGGTYNVGVFDVPGKWSGLGEIFGKV
jgi:streptogrisin C